MAVKLNISEKGKAWKLELSDESIFGKNVGDNLSGAELGKDFEGYDFEITGGSDSSGFPLSKDVEGITLKKVLLTKGWGMRDNRKGLRKRKTVRGKVISNTTALLNIKVIKSGKKKLEEIFPDQNNTENKSSENKAEDLKEEIKPENIGA